MRKAVSQKKIEKKNFTENFLYIFFEFFNENAQPSGAFGEYLKFAGYNVYDFT
jgi:hypothetical protein